jgi:hypothetical protein
VQVNLDNLSYLIAEQRQEANEFVRKQLQNKAEESMARMVRELEFALEQAMSSEEMVADMSVLEEVLSDAIILYNKASVNTGTQLGQYSQARVSELKDSIDHAETLIQTSPQTVINRAVKDLQNAIVRLLNSRVRMPTMILYDPASGVSVVVPRGAAPEDTILYVNIYDSDNRQADRLREYIAKEIEDILFYEIRLTGAGGNIRSVADMEIQIPESDAFSDKSVSVYSEIDSLEPRRLSSVRSGGYRVVFSEQTGTYALVVRASTAGYAGETENREDFPEQEMVTVTIAEETEIDLETEPDRIIEELIEDMGPIDEPDDDYYFGEEWERYAVLEEINIQLDELRRDSTPLPLVLMAAFLIAVSLALLIPGLSRQRSTKKFQ